LTKLLHYRAMDMRPRLSAYIGGSGIEVGPGHNPFPIPDGASVRYLDRWWPDENRALWPDMVDPFFPDTDLVANFDIDRIPLPDSSQDFVVCSHVLEHLADPIGFLADIHRVLRPGGHAIVVLPDRRYTFDSTRQATSFDHLVADYKAGVTEVADDHIADYLEALSHNEGDRYQLAMSYDMHRKRSVHAHCWTDGEFRPIMNFALDEIGLSWQCIDWLPTEGIEFGFVLERTRTLRERVKARFRPRSLHGGTGIQNTDTAPPLSSNQPAHSMVADP
jgi:predicted SAM-dependent methyltransferase